MEFPDKFRDMMEDESDDDDLEKVSKAFICCICRDLLYKPVVLACGHISCFWCVHKSMSGLHSSRCPICRNRYHHFPFICQMLHLLLLKMYPNAYKRRENQILGQPEQLQQFYGFVLPEEEKEMGYFSPQCSGHAWQPQLEDTIAHHSNSSVPLSSDAVSLLNPYPTRTGEVLEKMEQVEFGSVHQDVCILNMQIINEDTSTTNVIEVKDRYSSQINCSGTFEHVAVDDVICASCKSMLFRPIVLNCGHAFCSSCIVVLPNEMLKCEVCQSLHPGDIPKVCLEVANFLEQQFPKEYELRRKSTFPTKQEQFPSETSNTYSTDAAKESFQVSFSSVEDPLPWWNSGSKVHIGVGCDSCGLYPIIGDRYRCKDCVEQIGYDLCKECYTTRSKLPGRFNQQHTSDHQFEIVKSNPMQNMMLRLLRGQLGEVNSVSDAVGDDSANVIPSLPDETNENAEDVPFPSDDTDTNQNENQSSAERRRVGVTGDVQDSTVHFDPYEQRTI